MKYQYISTLILSFFFIFSSQNVVAQGDYAYAGGVRFGNPIGLDAKYFFADAHAVEAIIGIEQPRGWGLTALYEYHGDFNWRGDSNWFVGGGFSMMLNRTPEFSLGGDIILGYEYTFPTLPISFSLDWKPGYSHNFGKSGEYGLDLLQAALTLRYAYK